MDNAYIIALVWSFRALAACAGAFVVLEWATHRLQPEEFPPYNRVLNARAWVCAALGCIMGGFSYIVFDLYHVSPESGVLPNLGVLGIWVLWSAALIQRACARAEQPKYIIAAAGLIVGGAFLVLLLGGEALRL